MDKLSSYRDIHCCSLYNQMVVIMKSIHFFDVKKVTEADIARQRCLRPWPMEWKRTPKPMRERVDKDKMKINLPRETSVTFVENGL